MRAFAEAWPELEIVQQAVGQLPWGHNLVLLTKLKQVDERLAYAQQAIQHGWSRNVLAMQIETRLLDRQGAAVTNFEQRLPKPQSDLARESLKDPYRFDFLSLRTGKDTPRTDLVSTPRWPVEPTVGGRDVVIEPHGRVHGVLVREAISYARMLNTVVIA